MTEQELYNLFASYMPAALGFIPVVRNIFIVLSIILLSAIIILILRTNWFKFRFTERYTEFFSSRPLGMKTKFKKLESAHKKLSAGKESEYKMAVIEIDEFLKEVLQKMGYEGEMLNDILKQIDSKILPSIDRVKEVHEIRNSIVHDPSRHLTKDQAANMVRVYEQALSELEMI
ncbi:MAG: hypothetical protein A2365_04050 [Candidatus Nealsonbacteria bacterium RIFOXYB1_FULL_40_15]|uniref:DUF4145 domain-containing protein n=2 Tax=Candidatus Nealsoniibacteriota TaxID=1817911 RepID=A0A1G2EN68_9BACT|nr:MAG: hypothetical protein A2427_04465 [Candidatus Nealsonbacteria bacterium RIFOXYC1_FULL_40_7]OGZ27779.1 MAG: hypothetical protein A2365_04050 [Candidatus Nealsonbacteria bacterium RIFOXYB1_FULL_40_15]OGZ28621.1 MAG: hypothetical protein A2562_03750 [Candidatus Nealsonbacteria bacterium RIFOXYD1_FULL_39_11]